MSVKNSQLAHRSHQQEFFLPHEMKPRSKYSVYTETHRGSGGPFFRSARSCALESDTRGSIRKQSWRPEHTNKFQQQAEEAEESRHWEQPTTSTHLLDRMTCHSNSEFNWIANSESKISPHLQSAGKANLSQGDETTGDSTEISKPHLVEPEGEPANQHPATDRLDENPFLLPISNDSQHVESNFYLGNWPKIGGPSDQNKQTVSLQRAIRRTTTTTIPASNLVEPLRFSKSWNCPTDPTSTPNALEGDAFLGKDVALVHSCETASSVYQAEPSQHSGKSLLSAVFAIRKLSLSDESLAVGKASKEALTMSDSSRDAFSRSLLRFPNGSLSPEHRAPATPKIHLELPKSDAQSEYNREYLW